MTGGPIEQSAKSIGEAIKIAGEPALCITLVSSNNRDEGADIVIIARSDARQAVSLDEALWRARAFAEAGADVLFIDALETVDELRAFCQLGGAAAALPKARPGGGGAEISAHIAVAVPVWPCRRMRTVAPAAGGFLRAAPKVARCTQMANNLEGGKSPQLRPEVLQDLGFTLVAYPLSLLGVSVRAMQTALEGLAHGRLPPPGAMPSFQVRGPAAGPMTFPAVLAHLFIGSRPNPLFSNRNFLFEAQSP